MTEVILIIVFAVVLFFGYFFLRKLSRPTSSYIKILMAVALLVLVWFDWDEKNKPSQFILTALAVASIVREFFELRKNQKKAHL